MGVTDASPALFADRVGWSVVVSGLNKASVAVHPGKLLNTFDRTGMISRQQKSSYCAGKSPAILDNSCYRSGCGHRSSVALLLFSLRMKS
jgi:hypothetical protein